MKRTVVHSLVAWLGMLLCVLASVAAWTVLDPSGRGGQNVPTVAVLLFVFAVVLRVHFDWPFRDFIVAYSLALATLLYVISRVSGIRGAFNPFNLRFLLFFGFVVCIAWFGGLIAGTTWRRWKARGTSRHAG